MVLKNSLLFSLLFGLTCAIVKFEVTNLKPVWSYVAVRTHHMALAENTILSFKATAAPSDITFTIAVKVAKYNCYNIDGDYISIDRLGCSYDFETTLSVRGDTGMINWRTLHRGYDNGGMHWQNDLYPPTNITYCGKDVDTKHLVEDSPFNRPPGHTFFSYNGDEELYIGIDDSSVYVVFVSLYANHSQEGIEHFSLNYTLRMANGLGYLGPVDAMKLTYFWIFMVLYVFLGLLWMVVLAVSYKSLLKIHLWILLVIFLGALETAVFAGLYTVADQTGINIEAHPLYVVAKLVSSAQALLTKLLIIASCGHRTTVQQSVDDQMSKVVTIGALYGVFAILDGMYITHTCGLNANTEYYTAIALVVIDVIIINWVITSNRATRPVPKIKQNDNEPIAIHYKYMKITIAFYIIIGISGRLWPLTYAKLPVCLPLWSEYVFAYLPHYCLFLIICLTAVWWPSRNPEKLFAFPVVYSKDDFGKPNDQKSVNGTKEDVKGQEIDDMDDIKLVKQNLTKDVVLSNAESATKK